MKFLLSFKKNAFSLCLTASFFILLILFLIAFAEVPVWADPYVAGTSGLWLAFLGSLHPVFLHLPIGALLLIVFMEGFSILSLGRYTPNTSLALAFTVISSLIAFFLGYALYLTGSYTGDLIEKHKDQALIFTALLVLSIVFKLVGFYRPTYFRNARICYLISLFSSVIFMTLAGHNGGLITHGDPMDKWPSKVRAQRKVASEALGGDPVIFQHVVQPILNESCVYCHGADKQEGSLRLDSYAALFSPADNGIAVVSGDVANSPLIQRLLLPAHDDLHMPPSDKPQATPEEIHLLKWWVDQGAPEKKSKSELSVNKTIEAALASLVSPAERKLIEVTRKKSA